MTPPLTSWTRTEAADEACQAYLAGEKWQDIARRHCVSTMQLWRALSQRRIPTNRLTTGRLCEWCGARFRPYRDSSRYCCRACRFADHLAVASENGNTEHCLDCGTEFCCAGKNYRRCAPCRKRRREAK